jgi:hypothetical protein
VVAAAAWSGGGGDVVAAAGLTFPRDALELTVVHEDTTTALALTTPMVAATPSNLRGALLLIGSTTLRLIGSVVTNPSAVDRGDMMTFVDKSVIARAGASVRLGRHDDVGLGEQADPDQLPIAARLFADTTTGARLSVSRATIIGGTPRRGEAAIWKRYSGPPVPAEPEAKRQMLEGYRVQRDRGRADRETVRVRILRRTAGRARARRRR